MTNTYGKHSKTVNYLFHASADDFKKIPGSPIAYWVSDKATSSFLWNQKISDKSRLIQGMITGNNAVFLRFWFEINKVEFSYFNVSGYWVPYNKGGEAIKWYGNHDVVVNWSNSGKDFIRNRSVNDDLYFKFYVSWSYINSGATAARFYPVGFLWDVHGSGIFPDRIETSYALTCFLCSKVSQYLLLSINPTISFQVENIGLLPWDELRLNSSIYEYAKIMIGSARYNWDAYETSWDFTDNPLIRTQQPTLAQAFDTWQTQNQTAVAEMKRLEEENNKLFIDAYGLQDELTPDVPDEQITLTRADREKDSQRLMSYAMGCMMGRYSLDETGLVYANAGNIGFDVSRYTRFPADADGIVPITDTLWFEDDATQRIKEFLTVVWGEETLPANLAWLAHSLGKKGDESDEDTIRRYLSDKFYKDHLQTYKKRPIYWHFSSGKQGAFQALVYLHRYNESTLARMRAEYVVPLMGKLQSRIEMLTQDAQAATSTAARNKLNKQVENLNKKHLELLAFDEKLRHYADMRITLDLDDGVKVNYGKFGELLSDVKAITGGADE